jgi:GNAT superfamily N-acetyltransferase
VTVSGATPGRKVVEAADPRGADVQTALAAYFAELSVVFGRTFAASVPSDVEAARYEPPHGACLVARLDGRVVGTASLAPLPTDDDGPAPVGEVKRMWVDGEVRGLGFGRLLLRAVHDRAVALGFERLRLDTQAELSAARHLYASAGYVEIERYNDNPYATHFYELVLPA